MKKQNILLCLWISLFPMICGTVHSTDFTVQGQMHPKAAIHYLKTKNSIAKMQKSPSDYAKFTFDSIHFWVGEGENKAALAIDWYDDKGNTIVWGFRWPKDSLATGEMMVRAIAEADPRFSVLIMNSPLGSVIGGLGYDALDDGAHCLKYNNHSDDIRCPDSLGVLRTSAYDFDKFNYPAFSNFRWFSAWTSFGYWSYQNKSKEESEFSLANTGAGIRELADGDWDGWGAQVGWDSWEGVPPRIPFESAALPKLNSIALNCTEKEVFSDSQFQLSVRLLPLYAENKNIIWTSSDTIIATVDHTGFVNTLNPGSAWIFAISEKGGISDSCFISVLRRPISHLKLHKNTDTLYIGINESVSFSVLPEYTISDSLYWHSSAPNIVSVDSMGSISTSALGKAYIYVSNLSETIIDSCLLVVSEVDYTRGIFFVNEDWSGHSNGSLNFLTENGKFIYRAYTRENPGESFGAVTQHGSIYGENFYFTSKQTGSSDDSIIAGGQFVVADAKTLKKKAAFSEIVSGNAHTFLGINTKKGYIATTDGIYLFAIDSLKIGKRIDFFDSLKNNEKSIIGTMLRIGNHIFVSQKGRGILVIDASSDSLVQMIKCSTIGTIIQSLDGSLWAVTSTDGLWRIHPKTFEIIEKRSLPENAQIPNTWGAWMPTPICASHKSNTLYWAKMNGGNDLSFFGTQIYRYDIDHPNLDSAFYILPGKNEAFYGSAINIDPIHNRLVITTTKTGYGTNYQNHQVRFIDATTAELIDTKTLEKYYWFPAMSVFPDNYAPVISENLQVDFQFDTLIPIHLYLGDIVSDYDNFDPAIIKTITIKNGIDIASAYIKNDTLFINPLKSGNAKLLLQCNSNGKLAEEILSIHINIKDVIARENEKNTQISFYPNPVRDILTIQAEAGTKMSLSDYRGVQYYSGIAEASLTTINLSTFPNGVYILSVGNKSFKIIKQ